jgi:uncharacterized protein
MAFNLQDFEQAGGVPAGAFSACLDAANHGDEYEGQVALIKLCRTLEPAQVQGRIIILPAANFPAVMAGRRVSPLDDGNLNRCFPGNEHGSPTEMIAHFIESELLSISDYVLDLHSGGSSLNYVPTVLARSGVTPEKSDMTLRLLKAFGAPFGCMFKALAGENRTLSATAEKRNVVYLCTEFGGGGKVNREYLSLTEMGLRRVLSVLGALEDATEPAQETRILNIHGFDNYVYAPDAGRHARGKPRLGQHRQIRVSQVDNSKAQRFERVAI